MGPVLVSEDAGSILRKLAKRVPTTPPMIAMIGVKASLLGCRVSDLSFSQFFLDLIVMTRLVYISRRI